ncbi:MAG: TetR/AcrR family transcriptional regulator [Clostridia bacterium]|nr:TetR/AcrR family transcriptional regulator [Clostridia bacterium]
MKPVKEDLRVKKTKKLLCSTVLKLMQKKSLDEISVTDICEQAMVHRTTFYTHYEDKYHLLLCAFDDIKNEIFHPIVKNADKKEPKELFMQIAEFTLHFIDENREAVIRTLKHNHSETIISVLKRTTEENLEFVINHIKDKIHINTSVPMLTTFLAGGFVRLVLWWMENPKYTKQDLLDFASNILNLVCLNKQ